MIRRVRFPFGYVLCFAAGALAGITIKAPTRIGERVSPPAILALAPAPSSQPDGDTINSGGVRESASEPAKPVPPSGLIPYQLQDWMRARCKEGREDLALAAFLARPSQVDCEGMAESFAGSCKAMNPHFVAKLVLSLPPGKGADRALRRLLREWAQEDAHEALAFMETLPVDRLNAFVLGDTGFGLAELPGERLAAFACKLTDGGRDGLVESLTAMADQAGSWRNLQRFMQGVQKDHPNVKPPEYHLGIVFGSSAPEQVEQWIAASPMEGQRDMMINGYTRSFEYGDPLRALQWDARITSVEMRNDEVNRHVRNWLERDRAAALRWLKSGTAQALMTPASRKARLRENGLEAVP